MTKITDQWQLLHKYNKEEVREIAELFLANPKRAAQFSARSGSLELDFSRSQVTEKALELLLGIAKEAGLRASVDAMFDGAIVNETEQAPALHTWLRAASTEIVNQPGPLADAIREIHAGRTSLAEHTRHIRAGSQNRYGITGPVTDFVQIGMGGSALGPRLLVEALRHLGSDGPRVHILSSADGYAIDELLSEVPAESTVFSLASKSFSTEETLLTGHTIRQWLAGKGVTPPESRLIAITAKRDAALAWGILPDNILPMNRWVGGRFSLWSAMGLPGALVAGVDGFESLLAGALSMDQHFRDSEFSENLPVLLALTGIWHRNIRGYPHQAVVPYDHRLRSIGPWLQQLEMESNGKSVAVGGRDHPAQTVPMLLYGVGTDAQHSVFQAFHQGTEVVPIDFIGVARLHDDYPRHGQLQLTHMLAQADALAFGRDEASTRQALAQTQSGTVADHLVPHRVFTGNRPSNLILMDELNAFSIGQLLALYEHKTFVQSIIWGVNAFDQWGVELGKSLAGQLTPEWHSDTALDSPAAARIRQFKRQ